MKKPFVLGIGAVGVAAALFATFGSGTAAAINEYVGQTYDDAAQAISDSGSSPVIATRNGSFLPTGACIVTGSRNASFLDSSGVNPGGRVLLDLNCNNTFAAAGVPGNSLGSPEGRQARQDYEDQLAQAQAEQQQSETGELTQSGEVTPSG